MADKVEEKKEEKKQDKKQEPTEEYYKTLLRICYQRIPSDKQAEGLKVFFDALCGESPNDLPEKVDEEMFVNKLFSKLQPLSLFTAHRRLAVGTGRLFTSSIASSSKNNDSKEPEIVYCSNEKFASSLRFDLTPEAIHSLAGQIEKEITAVMDTVAAIEPANMSPKTVLIPLLQLDQQFSGIENSVTFLQNVHPKKEMRDASQEAEVRLSKFWVDVSMRKDVFKVLKAFSEKVDMKTLNDEWKRYLEHELRDYRRNGLDLEDKKYERVKEIKKRMSELSSTFSKNLNEENTTFIMELNELDGMTDDFKKARLVTDDKDENKGKYKLSIKYPDLFPILKKCKIAATRAKMLRAHNTRCIKENTPLIEELVRLRYERAQLLGKKNHSEFVLEIRMAKEPKPVWDFLHTLNSQMEPLFKEDMAAILAMKKEECEAMKCEFDGVIAESDFRYYCRMREERDFSIDHDKLKEYFPLQVVVDGALNIYQQLLSLKFVAVPENLSQYSFWHEDLQLYQVVDVKTMELMGHFFLDLHPREGKYGHACMCSLQGGCLIYDDEGNEVSKQYPVNAMLCNFPKPTADKPSLLSHDDVVTFFHEFGHVMHQICGQTRLCRFAGTRVERDFVEAPSQMLENWCWKAKSLNLMSGHFKDNTKKIPKETIEALTKSKNANCGILTKRQLFFGVLDQTMHRCESEKGVDTAALCRELQPKIMGVEAMKDTNMVASFGHLAGGYDAQYYGYMWSQVYSADMFYTMFGSDDALLDPKAGMQYRNKILGYGGSRDSMDSLTDFLGRAPNNEAFLKDKGLK